MTVLHLRMFEMAQDYLKINRKDLCYVGGYVSPVSDFYKKAGLAPAQHRVNMCKLGVADTASVVVDDWEQKQTEYKYTVQVLEHFEKEFNRHLTTTMSNKSHQHLTSIRPMLLAGADLVESFSVPGLWSDEDLDRICSHFGILIVERSSIDIESFMFSQPVLYRNRHHIHVARQFVYNDISSTKIRQYLARGLSVRYLVPDSIIQYIKEHKLYESDSITQNPPKLMTKIPSTKSKL